MYGTRWSLSHFELLIIKATALYTGGLSRQAALKTSTFSFLRGLDRQKLADSDQTPLAVCIRVEGWMESLWSNAATAREVGHQKGICPCTPLAVDSSVVDNVENETKAPRQLPQNSTCAVRVPCLPEECLEDTLTPKITPSRRPEKTTGSQNLL